MSDSRRSRGTSIGELDTKLSRITLLSGIVATWLRESSEGWISDKSIVAVLYAELSMLRDKEISVDAVAAGGSRAAGCPAIKVDWEDGCTSERFSVASAYIDASRSFRSDCSYSLKTLASVLVRECRDC